MPFMVSWPAVLDQGKQVDEAVISLDFFPTICEAADLPLPEGKSLGRGDQYQLFDLSRDPGEQIDLAGMFPEKLAELKAEFKNWRDPLPGHYVSRNQLNDKARLPRRLRRVTDRFDVFR